MSNDSTLCLHAGAKLVTLDEVRAVPLPPATATWTPVAHDKFIDCVRNSLTDNGATIVSEQHSLGHNGNRYFGLINLNNGRDDGGNTVVGIRNSHDKTYPAGLALGNRVFVCDNLSFSGEVQVIRKHTRWIGRDLERLVRFATGKLNELRVIQEQRFAAYKANEITDVQANDLIVKAMMANVIGTQGVKPVVEEWRTPSHTDFAPRNVWSLFNAFTEKLKDVQPATLSKRTIVLHGLMDSYCNLGV